MGHLIFHRTHTHLTNERRKIEFSIVLEMKLANSSQHCQFSAATRVQCSIFTEIIEFACSDLHTQCLGKVFLEDKQSVE